MNTHTIGQLLRGKAQVRPGYPALLADGCELTWAELDRLTDRYCHVLADRGVAVGSKVGLWSVNSVPLMVTMLALNRIGAVAVMLNTALTDRELVKICTCFELNYLIYGEGYKGCLFEEVVRRITDRRTNMNYLRLEQLERLVEASEEEGAYPDFDEEQATAYFLFTSGTTGRNKAAMLTHYNLVNNSESLVAGMRWTFRDRLCVTVPFFHCFGVTACIMASLHSGMSLVVMPRFRSVQCFEAIERERCTILSGVPSMFLAMLNNPEHDKHDLSSLRSGVIAGSYISPADYRRVCAFLGPQMHLQPSYGQTETSPACTLADYESSLEYKANWVGQAIPGVELRVVGEKGEILPPGQIGSIQTRGYHVMKGYYKMPLETRDAFTADGWLDTGDLGLLSDEGDLRICGRKKALIIRGGENISPSEIEDAVKELPGIAEIHVLGVPDPVLQEEICLCIVEKPGCRWMDNELRLKLGGLIASHKIPRYILHFDELPKTSSGKLALKAIEDICMKRLGLHYPPTPVHPDGSGEAEL